MTAADRHKFLPLALRVVGLIFIFGIYPLSVLWPSGWAWHSGRSEYLDLIPIGVASQGSKPGGPRAAGQRFPDLLGMVLARLPGAPCVGEDRFADPCPPAGTRDSQQPRLSIHQPKRPWATPTIASPAGTDRAVVSDRPSSATACDAKPDEAPAGRIDGGPAGVRGGGLTERRTTSGALSCRRSRRSSVSAACLVMAR